MWTTYVPDIVQTLGPIEGSYWGLTGYYISYSLTTKYSGGPLI